jgi:hypothetical protein
VKAQPDPIRDAIENVLNALDTETSGTETSTAVLMSTLSTAIGWFNTLIETAPTVITVSAGAQMSEHWTGKPDGLAMLAARLQLALVAGGHVHVVSRVGLVAEMREWSFGARTSVQLDGPTGTFTKNAHVHFDVYGLPMDRMFVPASEDALIAESDLMSFSMSLLRGPIFG